MKNKIIVWARDEIGNTLSTLTFNRNLKLSKQKIEFYLKIFNESITSKYGNNSMYEILVKDTGNKKYLTKFYKYNYDQLLDYLKYY